MWCGSVMVVLSGFRMTFVRSVLTCRARRIRMRRENACREQRGESQQQLVCAVRELSLEVVKSGKTDDSMYMYQQIEA